ncbi:MAG: hypothetical protein R2735_05400 [Microthrixaceae bacterium]
MSDQELCRRRRQRYGVRRHRLHAIPNSDAVIFLRWRTGAPNRRSRLITTYRLTGAALIVAFAGLTSLSWDSVYVRSDG